MDDEKLIQSGLSMTEISMLREKFIEEYSKEKGWNPKELTTQQMLEVVNQNGYKLPGMILS
ncbi:MAG: hypothetical protein M0R46_16735 [Candidatus Muirbacterium halophilum]|nr:hypothetical protein [Candidatus Muirbacterium halophilum]